MYWESHQDYTDDDRIQTPDGVNSNPFGIGAEIVWKKNRCNT